jgi:hypothetical protein
MRTHIIKKLILALVVCAIFPLASAAETESNLKKNNADLTPSIFGDRVLVFNSAMPASKINTYIQDIYNKQRTNQFGNEHYAFLFLPGVYQGVDVKVGYNTHVAGLGLLPDDVKIIGAVRTQDGNPANPAHPDQSPGALDNFWRTVENLAITPTLGSITWPAHVVPSNQNVWAVSQAAPIRRIHIINGDLRLFELGWSSGGFMADSKIDGIVEAGSQQQWVSRDSEWKTWEHGNWNIVGIGSTLFPVSEKSDKNTTQWAGYPFTNIEKTLVIRSKPYLASDDKGNYSVMVPALLKNTKGGTHWEKDNPVAIPISHFYIAKPDDKAAVINRFLTSGQNILLTPGVYHLEDSIHITKDNTIVLGLGLPVLIADSGKPAIIIDDVDGVKLAGVIVEAGTINSSTLLLAGESASKNRHDTNPTFLYDIFCRIGGVQPGSANSCVTINSNDVVGDNFWLWRADHGNGVGWTANKSDTGLIVNGNDVIIYGLAVEHFQKNQTVWNGENGKVFFYQSEIPYDVPNQDAWKDNGKDGYASYKVSAHVQNHTATGLGIYCYFRDGNNTYAENAIEAPTLPTIQLNNMVTFWLNGIQDTTGIKHIINGLGESATSSNKLSTLPSNR